MYVEHVHVHAYRHNRNGRFITSESKERFLTPRTPQLWLVTSWPSCSKFLIYKVTSYIAVGDYDPLRSISLFLGDGFGDQRSFDIRTSSAWSAQLWVDGLTATHYVYCCMLEQDSACESLPSDIADRSHWFKVQYLPEHHQTNIIVSQGTYPSSVSSRPSLRYWTASTSDTDHDDNTTHNFTTTFPKSGYFSDRSLTPTPTHYPHSSLPSRYRRSRPHSIKTRWTESPLVCRISTLPFLLYAVAMPTRSHHQGVWT